MIAINGDATTSEIFLICILMIERNLIVSIKDIETDEFLYYLRAKMSRLDHILRARIEISSSYRDKNRITRRVAYRAAD